MSLGVGVSHQVNVAVEGAARHLCPYREEVDDGVITISWRTDKLTLELHELRGIIDSFAEMEISHEEMTGFIQAQLAAVPGIEAVQVTTTWRTAGLTVRVQGGSQVALLREPIDSSGA